MASNWKRILTNPAVKREIEQLPHTLASNKRRIDELSKKVEWESKFSEVMAFCMAINATCLFLHSYRHKKGWQCQDSNLDAESL